MHPHKANSVYYWARGDDNLVHIRQLASDKDFVCCTSSFNGSINSSPAVGLDDIKLLPSRYTICPHCISWAAGHSFIMACREAHNA